MRLTPLLTKSRRPQNEAKVPFKAILPLALKPKVSGKGEKTSEERNSCRVVTNLEVRKFHKKNLEIDVSCLQEMAVMFLCMKEHDFNEQLCTKEIQQFQSCYSTSMKAKQLKKEDTLRGGIGLTASNAGPVIVNRVLSKFPPV